jgi:hypothetical protein
MFFSSRREMLTRMGTGLGIVGLAGVLRAQERPDATSTNASPLAPRPPHFPSRAKHVIHVYLNGGPSQVDTFDPKPVLNQYHRSDC